jgi:hypothetical protein
VSPFLVGSGVLFDIIQTAPSDSEDVTVPELLSINEADVPVLVDVSPVAILPLASGEFPFTVLTDEVNAVPFTVIPNPVKAIYEAVDVYEALFTYEALVAKEELKV